MASPFDDDLRLELGKPAGQAEPRTPPSPQKKVKASWPLLPVSIGPLIAPLTVADWPCKGWLQPQPAPAGQV